MRSTVPGHCTDLPAAFAPARAISLRLISLAPASAARAEVIEYQEDIAISGSSTIEAHTHTPTLKVRPHPTTGRREKDEGEAVQADGFGHRPSG